MTTIDQIIGQQIRHFRLMAGISQTELGNAVGVRFQQVQKYEAGQNRVSAARLNAVAETLSVPVQAFFQPIAEQEESRAEGDVAVLFDSEAEKDPELLEFRRDSRAFMSMMRKLARLNGVQRRAINSMIDAILSTECDERRPTAMPGSIASRSRVDEREVSY